MNKNLNSTKRRLYLVSTFYGLRPEVTKVLDLAKKNLEGETFDVDVCSHDEFTWKRPNLDDLVIAQQPIYGCKAPCRILGNLFLRRDHTLSILETSDVPVMKWKALRDSEQLLQLFDEWQVDTILLKTCRTYRAQGISLINRQNAEDVIWHDGDVFCKILKTDPRVFKVHFFGGVILGGYYLQTPSVENLEKLVEFLEPDDKRPLVPEPAYFEKFANTNFELDAKTAAAVEDVGKELIRMGGGYSSIDFMLDGDKFAAIELNPNTVGTYRAWHLWPEKFADNYAEGLRRLCFRYWQLPKIQSIFINVGS